MQDSATRILPFLSRWKGHSITRHNGVYGATIAEADILALLEIDDKGQLVTTIIKKNYNPIVKKRGT